MNTILHFHVLYIEPSSPPPLVRARLLSETVALITWNRLDCSQRNGYITGYQLSIKCDGKENIVEVEGDYNTDYMMKYLRPGAAYFVKVAAKNKDGMSTYSKSIPIVTWLGKETNDKRHAATCII